MHFFFIFAVLISTIIYGFFGIRIIQPAGLKQKWKITAWSALFICFASVPLAMTARFRFPDHPLSIPLSWFAYLTFGFFTLIFSILVFRDVFFLVWVISRWSMKKFISAVRYSPWCRLLQPGPFKARQAGPPEDASRRLFLLNSSNAALLGFTGAMTAYGFASARQIPAVRNVEISIAGLPPEFEGFRILQITDLHVGMTIRRGYVAAVVERANAQHPDLIVFTGDLADGHVNDLFGEAEPLSNLKAPFGRFFVTGNHEYYGGVKGWLAGAEKMGFIPLVNEHRIIRIKESAMVLSGVTDYTAGHIFPAHASSPEKALRGAPENLPRIMLAHQPKSILNAHKENIDLMLCGHTHGGQYIPWNYMVALDQPYVKGLHRHRKTQVYVSCGTGYWGPPMRIGAPSEISVIRLVGG